MLIFRYNKIWFERDKGKHENCFINNLFYVSFNSIVYQMCLNWFFEFIYFCSCNFSPTQPYSQWKRLAIAGSQTVRILSVFAILATVCNAISILVGACSSETRRKALTAAICSNSFTGRNFFLWFEFEIIVNHLFSASSNVTSKIVS